MDRTGVHHKVDAVCQVFRFLAIVDGCAFLSKELRQGGFPQVGSGNPEPFFQQDFRQAAHADASDPDKVYMDRMIKIDLIHKDPPLRFDSHLFLT